MNYKFPESYADCDLLPFNRTSIENDFDLKAPADEPGDSGVWLLLQGTRVLVVSQGKGYKDNP